MIRWQHLDRDLWCLICPEIKEMPPALYFLDVEAALAANKTPIIYTQNYIYNHCEAPYIADNIS
jgi:hypothetical protein